MKPLVGAPIMNKPSERIVVFVTPAQKRAISATADELGVSISELMRRAVIAFSATSDQVKAASIVDRLNAPRQPDALAQVLAKASKPLRPGRAATRPSSAISAETAEVSGTSQAAEDAEGVSVPDLATSAETFDDDTHGHDATRGLAQAVARLSAEAEAKAAAVQQTAPFEADRTPRAEPAFEPLLPIQPLIPTGFLRRRETDDAHNDDAAPEGGKFA